MAESGLSKVVATTIEPSQILAAPPGAARSRPGFLVVGVGASAGGLEACKSFVAAIPADSGMAFIIVQHLDPTHESMMVELLASHTTLAVSLAAHDVPVEPGNIYVIPPGKNLSILDGALQLARLAASHGARLPLDHLLRSIAKDCGRRGVCVILSGGGGDGSLGLGAIHDGGGLVIVQDPDEAGSDGMPRSAIATGAVDLVLAVSDIPAAIVGYRRRLELTPGEEENQTDATAQDRLTEIIELLRSKTSQDFKLYKQGTLGRRIERRMAMMGARRGDFAHYLAHLRGDPLELELLAKDLLIHVTSFFRDVDVFSALATTIVPDLVRDIAPNRPIRVWVPGCSTGEETYSLAMLFHEAFAQAGTDVKLQIFASDIDENSIAVARAGFYAGTVVDEVSLSRLERFFTKERDGYRISADLRASVVFTVQDVLADPPFSRIDLVSCRNLLIYLSPEAQDRVISLFHFATQAGGILLLGKAETVGKADGRFEVLSKKDRIYKHIGTSRIAAFSFSDKGRDQTERTRGADSLSSARKATPAEICRDLIMRTYAPAAVLVDGDNRCLFFFGPTDDYLRTAQG
jgi:two-component system CheB/CheR fusion protein